MHHKERELRTNPAAAGVLPGGQGVVLGGLPGTGKSLCARAIAGELDWPLLRLDIGRIFTGLLGGAEENLREALAMAEAMGPVVLLVDDLDRALGHGQGGGVSGRVMNTLLTWMQERDRGVFLAATISDPTALPVEVLRAGRFEHMFFFDLPGESERAELVAHCLRRHGRDPGALVPETLAAATTWLSHADIAGRVEESLFVAAAAGRLEPSPQELLEALRRPEVSKERKSEIDRLRRLWEGVECASEWEPRL
ncbi:MAG: AAA family ATPase [Bryobacteraceae bacterium]|jgi:SpoVK/Ycf46/Vps4 family AAA+-type ATPase